MDSLKIILVIIIWAGLYFFLTSLGLNDLNIAEIKEIISHYTVLAPLIFLLLFSIRIVLFIPSSLFIIAGSFFFDPLLIILLSVCGMVLTESVIYSVGAIFRKSKLHHHYLTKYPKLFMAIKENRGNLLMWIIATPIAPTDLTCFVASLSAMKYMTYIKSVIFGSLPLIILYSTFGSLLAKFPIIMSGAAIVFVLIFLIIVYKFKLFHKIQSLFTSN